MTLTHINPLSFVNTPAKTPSGKVLKGPTLVKFKSAEVFSILPLHLLHPNVKISLKPHAHDCERLPGWTVTTSTVA
jgi:hypothetical protein